MSMNELFTNEQAVTESSRELTGTAQLTALASKVANDVIAYVNDNLEEFKQMVSDSQKDHGAMDKLIDQTVDLEILDIEFLKDIEPEIIDGMIKSQQSKRSRAKSKQMTLDNYRTMLTGAIAENLLRIASGQPKSAGNRRTAGVVEYSEEELQAFKDDQELLRKELRNIQSKKSIDKNKADHDEESAKWQSLLAAEAKLKELRAPTQVRTVEVDTTKEKLTEALEGIDIDKLKAADSKELIERIKELL